MIFEGGRKLTDGVISDVAGIYPHSLKDAPDVSWSKEDNMRTGTSFTAIYDAKAKTGTRKSHYVK